MLKPILLAILLSAAPITAQESTTGTYRFASPDQKSEAIYIPNTKGSGSVHIKTSGKRTIIINTLDQHVPVVEWITNDLASININCGTPCWFRRYYDASRGIISREYEYAQDVIPSRNLVTHIESESFLVSEIFTGKTILQYKPSPSDCPVLLIYARLKFINDNILQIKCGNSTKTLIIPKP